MRVILTSSNTKLVPETKVLLSDLEGLFPTAEPISRKGRRFSQFLKEEAPGEAIIVRLDQVDCSRRRLLIIRKDSSGDLTTATYSIVSYLLCKQLGGAIDTGHMPEITLSSFSEDFTDASFVKSIEDAYSLEKPDFEGRQVVSFTKKRGFIFIRKHRYIVSLPDPDFPEHKEAARLDEIGPRLTIKLQSIDKNNECIFKHKKNIKLKD